MPVDVTLLASGSDPAPGTITTAPNTGPARVQYRLQGESISIDYDRPVVVGPLAGRADPILLDLGFFRCSITLECVVPETVAEGTNLLDGGVEIGNKGDLERFINNFWNRTITLTMSGDQYRVLIHRCNFKNDATNERFWRCTLNMYAFATVIALS